MGEFWSIFWLTLGQFFTDLLVNFGSISTGIWGEFWSTFGGISDDLVGDSF